MNDNEGWSVYDADLPVSDFWAEENRGKKVTIQFVADLYTLINVDGMDGMNNMVDDVTGVVLSDLTYTVGAWGPGDYPGPTSVLIEVTGVLEEF